MRALNKKEFDLIKFMLQRNSSTGHLVEKLAGNIVREMEDGGMGSLRFIKEGGVKEAKFGSEVAGVSIFDTDGTLVSFSINLDENNELFELDVFKADFSPLMKFPASPYTILPNKLIH